jgi:DNA-binding SARP family transcriptional activator
LQCRLLGPLEVLADREAVALGGPRQRIVLAMLLLDHGRVVSTDRLTEAVWGDSPPDGS